MLLLARRHPFLFLGLLTLALFFVVEALGKTGHAQAAAALAAPMRVLIIPMYVIWLLFTMLKVALAGPGGPPSAIAYVIWIVALMAGLAPYALADYVLARWRGARKT